jgi:phosphatidylcholine synthase
VATIIDATDGTFARRVRVKVVTPNFDGRRLDDLIDFLTYTCLPLFLLWRAEMLPSEWRWWLLVPLISSAYGFCQVSIKTEDGFFLGFPSYWNIVVFYLYLLRPPPEFTLAVLLTFSVLTFIPLRYLYPTQPGKLNRLALWFGIPWAILLGVILALDPTTYPRLIQTLTLISLSYPACYFAVSWAVSAWLWTRARSDEPATGTAELA